MGLGRMQGKAVLITGAALGIGRAAAVKFADEGANLVLQDIKPNELATLADQLTANGATVTTIVGDVSREADVQAAVALVIATYGRLDVAIANAGIIPLGDITVSTAADWDYVMSIDGRGMFLTCKYAIQEMLKTGGGAIVCTSSISGV